MNIERNAERIAERPRKTIYRDGDRAIKIFNEDYSKADILNEALNTARVEETGLNIPKILEVSKIDGKWAIITEYIEGKSLMRMMLDEENGFDKYLDLFVDLQMKIHEQRAPLLTKLKDKMNTKIDQTGLDATTRYELHERLEGMPKHNKVCHGDFNPANVRIRNDGTPFILDWAHVTQGNASADVARTYLTLHLYGTKEQADKYLQKFCLKSDTARQYVEKWMPIVAASQSVKGNAEEREFLLSWVHVVDFE